MRVPKLRGIIRRRILVNFRVDPSVMQGLLPEPFRPKLLGDHAVAGICLIRLEALRPRFLPASIGLSSENAAHRVAVRWGSDQGGQEGVYIPRRDSSSLINRLVGGRLFPGEHQPAAFDVRDDGGEIDFSMHSLDGKVALELRGKPSLELPRTSMFGSMREASQFFEKGSLGYSETSERRQLDGLSLVTRSWSVQPLEIQYVRSSFFSDLSLFPAGSVEFDCALLMRNIEHEWLPAPALATTGIRGRFDMNT